MFTESRAAWLDGMASQHSCHRICAPLARFIYATARPVDRQSCGDDDDDDRRPGPGLLFWLQDTVFVVSPGDHCEFVWESTVVVTDVERMLVSRL